MTTHAAYIGILTPGSTSRMRAEWLKALTPDWSWDWLDTDVPLLTTSRIAQSMAYRFQRGSAVKRINFAVREFMAGRKLDLAWVDKAIFLWPQTISELRSRSGRLIHFTPDTAFHANRSKHFEATLRSFDILVTTKSFEVDAYRRRLDRDTLHVTTQGFDPRVHHPTLDTALRKKEVAFIGLAEPSREAAISTLLDHSIQVRLAGAGWQNFVRRSSHRSNLQFDGTQVFGFEYSRFISGCWIGLGLVSKRFPELHTTRTFEIPACGVVLATERNSETTGFFDDDEALFFDSHSELAERIVDLFSDGDTSRLEKLATKGHGRVIRDGRDYPTILQRVLKDPRVN